MSDGFILYAWRFGAFLFVYTWVYAYRLSPMCLLVPPVCLRLPPVCLRLNPVCLTAAPCMRDGCPLQTNDYSGIFFIVHLNILQISIIPATKTRGPLCDFRCTLLLQLHFNSIPDAYPVHIELILCIMEKIVLSHIWCGFIRDTMSNNEGVKCSCSKRVALKIA